MALTAIMEVVMQVIISLIIGVIIAIPIVWIVVSVKNSRIKKLTPYQFQVKGGKDNGIYKQAQEEKTTRGYPIATDRILREHADRKHFEKAGQSATRDTRGTGFANGSSGDIERVEISAIKRELAASDAGRITGTKQDTKRNWAKFD